MLPGKQRVYRFQPTNKTSTFLSLLLLNSVIIAAKFQLLLYFHKIEGQSNFKKLVT